MLREPGAVTCGSGGTGHAGGACTYYRSCSFWRKNPHGWGGGHGTGGHECRTEACGVGSALSGSWGTQSCVRAATPREARRAAEQRRELHQPADPRALQPGTRRGGNVYMAESGWGVMMASGHCGGNPESRWAGLDSTGRQRGRRKSWPRGAREQSHRQVAWTPEATLTGG